MNCLDCNKEIDKRAKRCKVCANKGERNPAFTHGQSRIENNRLYRIWHNMKDRCMNPNSHAWKWYGSRGIRVSERWLKFENFYIDVIAEYNWHVRKYGIKDTTLDRIDNDGGYSSDNFRWVTMKEQINNRNI